MCDRVSIFLWLLCWNYWLLLSMMLMDVWVISKMQSPGFTWSISWLLTDFSRVVWVSWKRTQGAWQLCPLSAVTLSGFTQLCNSHTQSSHTSTQTIKMRKPLTILRRTWTCNTPASAPHMTTTAAEVSPLPHSSPQTPSHNSYIYLEERGGKKNNHPTDS